jgi:hypothetical protein
MKSVTLTWDLPVVRTSGLPADPADVESVQVELSADGGVNYGEIARVPAADPQTAFVPDLEVGPWPFRITAWDTAGIAGEPTVHVVTVPDESPLGPVTNIVATLG